MVAWTSIAVWLGLLGNNDTGSIQGNNADHMCLPQKIHLALTGDPTQMRVSWSTEYHSCHGKVYFGQALSGDLGDKRPADHLEMEADHMNLDSYSPDDFCGEPAISDNFDRPYLHTAVMSDLLPGAEYKYRIGKHGHPLRFRAALPAGADASFRFIAYGDMGESVHRHAKSPGAYLTAAQVLKEVEGMDANMVIHLGDISYADGVHKVWNSFLEQIEPYAQQVPYQVIVGNHEYDWKTGKEHHHHHPTDASGREEPYSPDWGNYGNDSGGECGVTFSKIFAMPGSERVASEADRNEAANHRADIPNPPFWYSYDYGSVHFIALSSEHDLTKGSHQRKWLEHDLASVDRCVTPWLIVLLHRPLYVVYPHKSNRIVGRHLQDSLEDLFENFQVDMVMSGHVHAYARTCNMYKEKCIRDKKGGMTHMTLGNGGRKLSEVEHEQPDWLEYADRKWGFARVSVEGSESLLLEYVSSETGKVRDSVNLSIAPSATRSCNVESAQRRS